MNAPSKVRSISSRQASTLQKKNTLKKNIKSIKVEDKSTELNSKVNKMLGLNENYCHHDSACNSLWLKIESLPETQLLQNETLVKCNRISFKENPIVIQDTYFQKKVLEPKDYLAKYLLLEF